MAKRPRKRRKKNSFQVSLEFMTLLHTMDTQEVIRLRSMLDEELVERKIDLKELKMNRRKKMIKFIHWLKYGHFT